tara:strand:+ start:39 stop:2411 length:2373 start_codon:yes stop_codon:yes gene_type:complete
MYQPSTNFFGKDSMKWWIGQVTDPDKGEWRDCLESTQSDNGEETYRFRCRVRIVGYHDCADDLPDKDLPLAHILLPPNTATTGGCGETVQYQGGEVVVGFFMDGDDAQQPVIFGTLFRQTFVSDELTSAKFNAKKQTCFTPYTPPKVVQTSGKQHQFQQSPWTHAFTDGEYVASIAGKQKEASTNIVTDTFSPCEDNEISKISNAIKDFTRKLETLQELNESSTYVDPIYGGLVDIQSELKLATTRIHSSMTKLVRRGRSWLIQETLDKLDTTMEGSVDKFNQVVLGQATNALTSVIFCNIEKIQDGLLDYLSKSLENMIGQVLDVPICGIENFMGDMFGQINNLIDSSLGGLFDQLNNIQGGGIALPSETFSKAIRFANILTNILDCDKVNCPPDPTSFSSKGGVSKSIEDAFDNIIDKVGLNAKLTPLLDSIDNAIAADPSAPDCTTNVLKCGPPRVDFIGSSGQGATGSSIVNALGQIIGVSINGPGFGFEEPPLLSFFDSCDKGYGAGGHPVLGPVSPVSNSPNTSAGGIGGFPVTVPNPSVGVLGGLPVTDPDSILPVLPVNAGGTGGTPLYDNDGNPILTEGGVPVVTGGTGGIPILSDSVGGDTVDADLSNVYVNDPNGTELGVVDVVMTSPGQEYLPNTTETDIEGNVKELVPDPNGNYDGETSYVTSLDNVVVDNTGFGYNDNDTATVSGGGTGDGTGVAEVELNIQNGLIVGVNVTNGGFGFTGLPDITINSDTGAGAKLLPVLKFTRVDDAAQLADVLDPFNRDRPQDVVVTVINCIDK